MYLESRIPIFDAQFNKTLMLYSKQYRYIITFCQTAAHMFNLMPYRFSLIIYFSNTHSLLKIQVCAVTSFAAQKPNFFPNALNTTLFDQQYNSNTYIHDFTHVCKSELKSSLIMQYFLGSLYMGSGIFISYAYGHIILQRQSSIPQHLNT